MSFKGGVHPEFNKITAEKKIEAARLPAKIILPLSQHIGAPCEPIVAVGDSVKTGQIVARGQGMCSPIHSSVSGIVKSIEKTTHPVSGKPIKSIIIESDGKDEKIDMPKRDYSNLSKEEIINIIKDSGIVGLGGAGFPTYVKLNPPKDKKVETLIINGAECEPYLTSDHRLMVEKAEEVIKGVKILMKALDLNTAYIGIEDNKEDAIEALTEKAGKEINVVKLHAKYPQGGEKPLIYAITGKKVPAGGLPLDVGCIVQNAGTAFAVYEAVELSKPLYERIVTITGKVKEPKNLIVRNGTLINELIEQVGGYSGTPEKLIMGGPMMGFAMPSDDLPVLKSTSGIIAFDSADVDKRSTIDCIRCGKCVKNCPMNLHPVLISQYAENEKIEKAEELYAMDCYECGCCAYGCPSKIALVHWIRYAKAQIMKKRSQIKK